jgi:hypothetical protein
MSLIDSPVKQHRGFHVLITSMHTKYTDIQLETS